MTERLFKRVGMALLPLALISGLVSSYDTHDSKPSTAAVVEALLAAPVAAVVATTIPPTTIPPTTAAPTTTLPPAPPVYKLEEFDGVNIRFNPCQNPIKILLNPNGHLSEEQQSRVEELLASQAAELSLLTGMEIAYGGLTAEIAQDTYKNGEKILIHFGLPGEGLLAGDDTDFPYQRFISWDRTSRPFREMDSYQWTLNTTHASDFSSESFEVDGKWYLMQILGSSLGLAFLFDADMSAAGVPRSQWQGEAMYVGSGRTEAPEWGPGDRIGLAAVGAVNGCF